MKTKSKKENKTNKNNFDIPSKYGKFNLKKEDGEIRLIHERKTLGVITMPFYTGNFYISTWGFYKEDKLIEVFSSLEETLKYADKSLKIKESKPTLYRRRRKVL